MDFEKWYTNFVSPRGIGEFNTHKELCKYLWDSAHEGLIDPEERKVLLLPTEAEWAKRPWATYLKVAFCSEEMSRTNDKCGDRFAIVERPKSAWVPNPGDPVFVKDDDGFVVVRFLKEDDEPGWEGWWRFARKRGLNGWLRQPRGLFRKFDVNQLGLDWEDIQ
jgi:hypothetical protein